MTAQKKIRFESLGWILFVFSAICYTLAGLKSGDILSTSGSLLFLVACFLFLAPIIKLRPIMKSRDDDANSE